MSGGSSKAMKAPVRALSDGNLGTLTMQRRLPHWHPVCHPCASPVEPAIRRISLGQPVCLTRFVKPDLERRYEPSVEERYTVILDFRSLKDVQLCRVYLEICVEKVTSSSHFRCCLCVSKSCSAWNTSSERTLLIKAWMT